jgi:hypothetical protein
VQTPFVSIVASRRAAPAVCVAMMFASALAAPAGTDIGARAGTYADCRPPTLATTDVARQRLYQWRDAEGRVVFGDRPPEDAVARNLSPAYAPGEQFARVTVTNEGSRFAGDLESVIGNDVEHMGRMLRDALQVPVRQIHLNMTLYPSAEVLREHHDVSRLYRNLAGLYQQGRNAVSVADLRDFDATRRLARHEASHALLAGVYGPTPVWLNEGLAEVLSMLAVAGQTRSLDVHERHARNLQVTFRAWRPGALQTLLAMQPADWGRYEAIDTYAPSWALVYDLLSDAAGRTTLQAVLEAQLASPCSVLDSVSLIDTTFPGGVRALEQRWQQRMRDGGWQALWF